MAPYDRGEAMYPVLTGLHLVFAVTEKRRSC